MRRQNALAFFFLYGRREGGNYIKGTVSRDFLLLVFFMIQFPPSSRVFHLDRDNGGKFATGVNDTGGNFADGISDTGGKFFHHFRYRC